MPDNHEPWLRRAIDLARSARERGDHPFGALLVTDGRAIATARNAVNTDGDVTQHAELRLISKASRTIDPVTLGRATLYTSTEPCAMCCGAIYWAGVRHVVFGFAAAALESMTGGTGLHRSSREVLGAASDGITIEGPILADAARSVHEGFW